MWADYANHIAIHPLNFRPSYGPASLKNYGNMFNGTSRSGHFLLAGRRNAVSSTLLNRSAPLGTIIRCCFPQGKQVALQVIFNEIDVLYDDRLHICQIEHLFTQIIL